MLADGDDALTDAAIEIIPETNAKRLAEMRAFLIATGVKNESRIIAFAMDTTLRDGSLMKSMNSSI